MEHSILLFFLFTSSMAEMVAINFHTGVGSPEPLEDDGRLINVTDFYFEQRLNHFSIYEERTWMQRYWENSTYYVAHGPVLLLLGGEETGNPSWMDHGSWHIYAKDLGAMMFMLEHRYFGESRPTQDTSTDNLEYLHVDQALADIAYFINTMTKKYNYTSNTKWITLGGSYAGNLAAWSRMKFPHLVHAAVSSSAPILAKLEYEDFLDRISQTIEWQNGWCFKRLRHAFQELDYMVQSAEGRIKLSKELKLCDWLSDKEEDIAILYLSLVYNLANQIQKYPEDDNGYMKLLCDYMTNLDRWKKKTSSIQRFLEYMKIAMKVGENDDTHCLPSNFNDYYRAYLADQEWESADVYGRQWQYLTCTQLGYHQTSTRVNSFFGRRLPLRIFLKACNIMFGFSPEAQSKAIERTNIMYGGFENKVSRVVYVSGTADPWYSLTINDSSRNGYRPYRVFVIKGGGHCADLYSPSDQDSVSLRDTREHIRNTLRVWANEN